MSDTQKTKSELIIELRKLRQRVAKLEKSIAKKQDSTAGRGVFSDHIYELVDSISDVFFAMDKNLCYTYWNKASEKLTGIAATDALGKCIYDIFPDIKGTPMEEFYLKVLKSRKHGIFINEYRLDGRDYVFEINAYPSGNGLSVYTKDITARRQIEKALQESEEKRRSFMDEATEGFAILDSNLDFIECNEAGARILGLTRERIIGSNATEISPDLKKSGRYEKYLEVLKTGRPFSANKVVLYQSLGSPHISLKAFKIGDCLGIIISDMSSLVSTINQIEAQRDLITKLNMISSLDDGLRLCTETAIQISGMDCGGVYLLDDNSGCLHLKYHKGLQAEFIRCASHFDSDSDNVKLVMKGEPVYSRHSQLGIKLEKTKKQAGLKAIAVVPFKYKDKIIGCMNIASHSLEEVPISARNILEAIAGQIGIIIGRLKMETELRSSEKRYRDLADSLPQVVYEANADGYLTFVNKNAYKLLGFTAEDIKRGMIAINVMAPEDRSRAKRNFHKIINGFKSDGNEYIAMRKDGIRFPVIVHSHPIFRDGKPAGLRGLLIDITDRKMVELKLQDREAFNRAIVENSPMGISVRSPKGKLLSVNNAWKKIWNYTDEQLREYMAIDPPRLTLPAGEKRLAEWVPKVRQVYKKGGYLHIPEIQIEGGPYHKTCWVSLTYSAIMNESGEVDRVIIFTNDISQQKLAEQVIRESELRYRTTINSLGDGVHVIDREFRILLANSSFKEWCMRLNLEPNLIGKSVFQAFPFLGEEIRREYAQVFETGKTLITEEANHFDGNEVITETRKIPIYDNDVVTRVITIVRDVTETKRLQRLEERAQRLETAGRVAGQVAHDFNNLLAPLVAYPEFIRDELPKNHQILKFINDIENSANKIAEINQQLLTLSRRGHYNQETININEIVQHAIRELGFLPKTLILETDFEEDILNIKGGAGQIHRIISNLLNNARDAMQDIGNVSIRTENYYADDLTIEYGRVPKGEYVKLTITDTGCGIPDKIRANIFDPFFTTKISDKKRGSGLGLSVVDAVVKDHNGFLDLRSVVGEGTSFYLYFPITREKLDTHANEEIVGGIESILVVDDDTAQCEVTLKLLEKLGYRANAVESGELAIEFLKENPHDLLILDMIMPGGIDGAETYQQVLEFNPEQKALIISGFAESERVDLAVRLGAGAYIRKPLTLHSLARALRKALDGAPVPAE